MFWVNPWLLDAGTYTENGATMVVASAVLGPADLLWLLRPMSIDLSI